MARAAPYRTVLAFAAVSALVAALGPTGCVLFVPDQEFGTDCQFAGSGAPCGACIAAHCQVSVNACCADSTCAGTLGALERCATSDASGCADVNAAGGALARCASSNCAGVCPLPATGDASTIPPQDASPGADSGAVNATSGSDATNSTEASTSTTSCHLVAGTAECVCDQFSTPNDVKCDMDTFADRPATLCYKGAGQCECDHMGCHMSSNDCICNLPDINPTQPFCAGSGPNCCLAEFGLCDCTSLDCGGPMVLTSCTVSAMVQLLPATYQVVEHCSEP